MSQPSSGQQEGTPEPPPNYPAPPAAGYLPGWYPQPAPPRPPSEPDRAVRLIAAVLGVLFLGIAAVLFVVVRANDGAGTTTAEPTTGATAVTAPATTAPATTPVTTVPPGAGITHGKVHLEMPATLLGVPQSTDPTMASALGLMEQIIAPSSPVEGRTAAYGNEVDRTLIIAIVVAGSISDPATVLSSTMNKMSKGTFDPKSAVPVDPGPMGGSAACGGFPDGTGGFATICAWVDGDSVGVLGFEFKKLAQVKPVFITARDSIETPL